MTAAALVASLLAWNGVLGEMPERVPVHWGITGEADDWADRAEMLSVAELIESSRAPG